VDIAAAAGVSIDTALKIDQLGVAKTDLGFLSSAQID